MAPHENLEQQLHKLNFHSHMDLIVEFKQPSEGSALGLPYEAYDENWLFIRVVRYVEGGSGESAA
jgi:hypothetical protein